MKTNKKTKEELKLAFNKAALALREVEEQELMEVARPEVKRLVGKCFKYMNTYGAGDGGRRWPLYLKVLSCDEETLKLDCVRFQKTSLEKVEVELYESYTWRGENFLQKMEGYIPVSVSEYNRAKKSLLKTIQERLSL